MQGRGPASVARALADAEVEILQEETNELAVTPDDRSPTDGRYSSDWPDTYNAAMIAEEAKACVHGFLDDWGWELHRYARLNLADRALKVLRHEIHVEDCNGYGKQEQVLNWKDSEFGQTPLWWTAVHGNHELASRLIDAKADINVSDIEGWSPLVVAAFYGHTEVVRQLVAAGVDRTLTVVDGETAYDKALAWDRGECAALLRAAI